MSPVIEVRQLHKPTALQLLAMAGWTVALGLAAARFFRWE